MASDILLDVATKNVLNVLLLELALHHKLVVAINGTSRSQLCKQEGQQVLGLSVQPGKSTEVRDPNSVEKATKLNLHFGDFCEVDKCGLLSSNLDNLGRPHDKLLLFTNC